MKTLSCKRVGTQAAPAFATIMYASIMVCVFILQTDFSKVYAYGEEKQIVDRVVAVVNNEIIALSDLQEIYKPFAEKVKTMDYSAEEESQILEKARQEMLDELINQKLAVQETRKQGITVSDGEVDLAIEQIIRDNAIPRDVFVEELAKEGFTLDEYREKIRERILRSRLLNLEIRSKVIITRKDVENYYKENIDEYQGKNRYHLRYIVMLTPDIMRPEDKEEVRKRMEKVHALLEKGVPFQEAAKQYSEVLADEGGELGLFTLDNLSDTIRSAVTKLEPGTYSPVLETDAGFQIIFLEEILPQKDISLESVYSEIEEKLKNEYLNKTYEAWLKNLRKRSHIKVFLN